MSFHVFSKMAFLGLRRLYHSICFCLLFGLIGGFGQLSAQIDTTEIQRKTKKTPRKYRHDPADLAIALTKNYTDDASKVIAITYWIAKHIKYDVKAFEQRKIYGKSSVKVLKKKKALCGEYAQLLKEMCNAVGIDVITINGYTRAPDFLPADTFYRAEHAWSVVKIHGHWHLLDQTWGSGKVVPRKQFLAKLGWALFNIPYRKKGKYVQSYNKNWFYVPPNAMIETHFPALNLFQFLSRPIPIDSFSIGASAIQSFISQNSIRPIQPPKLNEYADYIQLEKWLYEAEFGRVSNQKNHRIEGFNYYLAANQLFKNYYDQEEGKLNASSLVLDRILAYCNDADSLIKESLKDNRTEYYFYANRSRDWKTELNKNNKSHRSDLRKRKQLNVKEIKAIDKGQRRNISIRRYTGLQARKLKYSTIYKAKRPKKPRVSKRNSPESYLANAKESIFEGNNLLNEKDEIIFSIPETNQIDWVELENALNKVYRRNFIDLKKLVRDRKIYFSLIHPDSSILKKRWFKENHRMADSLNQNIIYDDLKKHINNQEESLRRIRKYMSTNRKALSWIYKAKRISFEDLSENEFYVETLNDNREEGRTYINEIRAHLIYLYQVRKIIKREFKYFKKSEKQLAKDLKLEKLRHQEYIQYRKFILSAENARMNAVRRRINFIKTKVKRAMREA